MISKYLGLIVVVLGMTGCGSTASLNSYGSQVKIVKTEPLQCEDIGLFLGRGNAMKYAYNNLLNIVGKNGGDHVYIVRLEETSGVIGNDQTAYGRGFNCRNSK